MTPKKTNLPKAIKVYGWYDSVAGSFRRKKREAERFWGKDGFMPFLITPIIKRKGKKK